MSLYEASTLSKQTHILLSCKQSSETRKRMRERMRLDINTELCNQAGKQLKAVLFDDSLENDPFETG